VSPVVQFVVAAVALAVLASLVGQATERLGDRLGPGATGVLQSALGNLPELFVGVFALRAGLVAVVQASLVGSILGNSLLVLGLAFMVGGARHGVQRFASDPPRMISTMTLLAVAALAMPTLVHSLHTPAEPHAEALSVACAIVLLVVFAFSIPFALRGGPTAVSRGPEEAEEPGEAWPVWLAATVLAAAGIGAAFASDWFVNALRPAMAALGLSDAFTGLVVVAIAGNAVENVVGIQLAAKNKTDYAISVILNSSLQVALGLAPVLVLLSLVVGTPMTLVLPELMVAALFLAALISALVVTDGKSTWLEGAILIGLYCIIAASFWWG
jgi:Ca2+:H+ antiporter